MYERFTDRARKIFQLANQEALRFHHEYIGTEHVLLGMIKEGSGVAAHVLKSLMIDPRKIRLECEKLMRSGPDMVTLGKLPQTPRVKKVVEHAMEEAMGLQHNYVGTEHVLLGLIREQEGIASQVLTSCGLTAEMIRKEVLTVIGADQDQPPKIEVRGPSMDSIHAFFDEMVRTHDQNRIKYTLRSEMGEDAYHEAAGRLGAHVRLLHGVFTVQTESGELLDAFKKTCYYGSDLDMTNVKEECGDVLWGIQLICDEMGWTLDDVISANVEKLKARYPEKWAQQEALNRDLDAEREALGTAQ